MAKPLKPLTPFGKDLDDLLEQAGKLSIREYADQAGVDYQYISQLRHIPNRHPGRLYASLLKPFARLKILGVAEAHQLSVRHRGKPLSLAECKDIFPELPDQELAESLKQALESRDDKTAVAPPVTLSPLYQRVFIGREAELQQLESAFNNAVSGQGSLVMVVGEPGIGKTSLCEQLAAYVTTRGGKTLVGHCYSERSLSLPYLAFVEALDSYVRSRDAIELKKEIGSGGADIARIIPKIRERLRVEPRPRGDPDEERYRLMQSVVGFLGNAASIKPLLLVLEDLHNADKGTLEMLTHVSRNLAGNRLLLLGTYRDIEVDRAHPLSSALSELRRLPNFVRVLLRGLNADEVRRMLASITGQEVPWGLVEAVYRQTEGNPLFVQEVVRYLAEEGVIPKGGDLKRYKDTPVEMRIPDGLKDVIGKRLSSLSDQCNRVLAVASVIGREFPLTLLQKIMNLPDEDLFKVLEEAKKTAVVEEKTGTGTTVNYRFAHAFFRQTLYEEIIAPRRIRLHQQVARALEVVYKTRLEGHATELAEHFSYSSDAADLKKAVHYGEMAAKRATDVYAYGEAVRLLEQAIKVQEILDPEDKAKMCDLTLELGDAHYDAEEHRHILDNEAPRALSLAESINDTQRACRACQLATNAMTDLEFIQAFATTEGVKWVKTFDRYAPPDTPERARVNIGLGLTKMVSNDYTEAFRLFREGTSLAQKFGDNETFLRHAAMRLFVCPSMPAYVEEARGLVNEMAPVISKTRRRLLWRPMIYIASFWLGLGDRKRAEETVYEYAKLTTSAIGAGGSSVLLMTEACFNIIDGRLGEAGELLRSIVRIGQEEHWPVAAGTAMLFSGARRAGYQGRTERFLMEIDQFQQLTGITTDWPGRAYLCAHAGRQAEAQTILDAIVNSYATSPGEIKDWFPSEILCLEAAVLVHHVRAAEALLTYLADTPFKTTGFWYPTCVARHLGGACALLGRYEEARKYYDEAIKVCTEMRFRPELALTRLQLAELLLEHYPNEKKEAVEHLDFCIKEFREMKMQPSLERALRPKEILKA